MADEVRENWIILKDNKYYPSSECGYYQKSDDHCHHNKNKGKCSKNNCPFSV